MTQQMGAFSIGFTELEQGRIDCTAEVMRLLGAVVVRAEARYAEKAIVYVAMSPLFDELQHGAAVPEYTLVVVHDAAGFPERVEAVRQED